MPSIADRVRETTTTTGTGTVNLEGAVTGFQMFSAAFSTGTEVYYCLSDGTNWEIGYGAVTVGSPWTLARSTVLQSSNADALVNFGAGIKDVFCTMPAAALDLLKTASGISNTPAGNLVGTNIQAVVNELDGEKAGLALANTFTNSNTFSTNVGIGIAPNAAFAAYVSGTYNDGNNPMQVNNLGTGRVASFARNVSAATRPAVTINQSNATGGSQAALAIQQADTGEVALGINTDGSLTAFNFEVLDTGEVTASNYTTAQGFAFPATQNPSANANTLDDYEEGVWTPADASGAGLSLTSALCKYTKIGNSVKVSGRVTYPSTANTNQASFSGLPFTSASYASAANAGTATADVLYLSSSSSTVTIYATGLVAFTNASMSGKNINFSLTYST